MDITEYERLLLAPVDRPLIHPYSDAANCAATIRCVALEEVLASKLKCLLQRRQAQDLFDYVHWLAFGPQPVSAGDVLRVFLQKTIYSSSPGAALALLLRLPLQLIRDAWSRFIVCPALARLDFDDAVERFMKHLRGLFQGYSDDLGWFGKDIFFPAELRDVIMEAGTRQTLVRMVYKGSQRLVEPYSLKFKKLKGGGAREYFYGFERIGGSPPPGIKSYVSDFFQSAQITDTPFEPQYLIEVSKAGDASQSGSFSRRLVVPTFGIARTRRRALGLRYLFRCPMCRRLFRRADYDNALGQHKGRSGCSCGGSFGTYVGTGS